MIDHGLRTDFDDKQTYERRTIDQIGKTHQPEISLLLNVLRRVYNLINAPNLKGKSHEGVQKQK